MDGFNEFNQFIALHRAQLSASGIPQIFWKSLYCKLSEEIFDAGDALQLLAIDYDNDDSNYVESKSSDNWRPGFAVAVCREQGIKASDPTAIFLIDHAWTFRWNMARQQLEQLPELANRMCTITGVDAEDSQRIDKLLVALWRYCHSYTILHNELSDEERTPIWYVMDELGSAISHSDEPNFRLVPFLHLNTRMTYSVFFPVRNCSAGDYVTRNYVEEQSANKRSSERSALLLPWRTADLRHIHFIQSEPDAAYFSSGHIMETYAKGDMSEPQINHSIPLRVYAEYDILRAYLNASCFELVFAEEDADVLWLTRHFKTFDDLTLRTPNKFINQFPFEYIITTKDLLCVVCRRAAANEAADAEQYHHNPNTLETSPAWLPTTYNLKTELLQFISYYQHRMDKGLDNHWIVKPWNLARGLDTHITKHIEQIVRLQETGPKIVQKYIDNPVLFYRPELLAKVKFDIRYVLLLKSVRPLEAYIHKKFYLRFANKPFSLDHFDDYEKHFTVMNYRNTSEFCHIKCEDFLCHWEKQYPAYSWTEIEKNICAILSEVLICASKYDPPCGIVPCPQSRAMYAVDVMLEWRKAGKGIQPKLLEVNWTPDCERACEYYPEFFNDIFKLLFLDEKSESFKLLNTKV